MQNQYEFNHESPSTTPIWPASLCHSCWHLCKVATVVSFQSLFPQFVVIPTTARTADCNQCRLPLFPNNTANTGWALARGNESALPLNCGPNIPCSCTHPAAASCCSRSTATALVVVKPECQWGFLCPPIEHGWKMLPAACHIYVQNPGVQ